MTAQPVGTQGRVRLTEEQVKRLEAAIIRRPARKYVDPFGNTRVTQVSINQFVSSLVKFYRLYGYLTAKQYALIAHIVQMEAS